MDAAFRGLEKLWRIAVAGIEPGIGVYDPDYGPGESVLGVAEGFDEDFAEEEGEVRVAVGGEGLAQAGGAGEGGGEVVVVG